MKSIAILFVLLLAGCGGSRTEDLQKFSELCEPETIRYHLTMGALGNSAGLSCKPKEENPYD